MTPLIRPYQGISPRIADDAFVAPGAVVIGDVEIGAGASLWYNVVVRGDSAAIKIGPRTNIQDLSMIHGTRGGPGPQYPCTIGADCLVGHNAVIHGCSIGDGCFIGMSATLMDGVIVEDGAMIAAGALVTPGKRVPSAELWGGSPARKLRDLTREEAETMIKGGVALYCEEAKIHRAAGEDD